MKRSAVPPLLLAAGTAWTAGQAVLPDMGLEEAARLAAVAAARPAQALATALFVLAGGLLVAAAVAAGSMAGSGRGSRAVGAGTLMLGLGGLWLTAGRGAFNLQMYRLTDPALTRDAAVAALSADVGPGFVPLLLTLPALLLGPVVLAVGLRRAGRGGWLPLLGLAAWPVGIGAFMASEFTVKVAETAGVALATVGLTVLGVALARPTPSAIDRAVAQDVPAGTRR